jgi:hypothetical protein
MLSRAGFDNVVAHYDRRKLSGRILRILTGWYVGIGSNLFQRRLERRDPDVARENRSVVEAMNSAAMLTSRSIIAVARKGTLRLV